MRTSIIKQLGVFGLATLFAAQAIATADDEAIRERITLIGDVCVEGDEGCGVAAPVASAGPKSPDDIYNNNCTACHATGAAGAPVKGNKAAWAPRIAQGMDVLFDHAWNGLNGMPAKGLCMDCSEDDIKATIKFMVDASK